MEFNPPLGRPIERETASFRADSSQCDELSGVSRRSWPARAAGFCPQARQRFGRKPQAGSNGCSGFKAFCTVRIATVPPFIANHCETHRQCRSPPLSFTQKTQCASATCAAIPATFRLLSRYTLLCLSTLPGYVRHSHSGVSDSGVLASNPENHSYFSAVRNVERN